MKKINLGPHDFIQSVLDTMDQAWTTPPFFYHSQPSAVPLSRFAEIHESKTR